MSGSDRLGNRPRDMREQNLRLVLRLFREKGILTIQQVASLADLSRTTAAKLVNWLLERELLLPLGKGSSTEEGGKKPELFCFNGGSAYVISIFLHGTSMTAVLYDLNCDRLAMESARLAPAYGAVMDDMAGMIQLLLRKTGITAELVRGIAIGCQGIVDTDAGVLRYPLQQAWGEDLPLCRDLRGRLPFAATILLDNIHRFFGYAEACMARPRTEGCMVTLYSDKTAGGCVIMDNRPLRGVGGFLGELGHVTLEADDGSRCSCGNTGCFEALIAPSHIIAGAEELGGGYPNSPLHNLTLWSMEDFFKASNEGDSFANAVLDRVANRFATMIHNIILFYDPAQIAIQGLYAGAGAYFLERLRVKVEEMPFFGIRRQPAISYSKLSFSSENPDNFALGGALTMADSYLDGVL